jgi:uncharacterized membrane protein
VAVSAMWGYAWPILLVIAANTFYNIATKSTPQGINPFATLTITYLTAAFVSVLLFYMTAGGRGLFGEIKGVNWTSITLGLAIVALEFGYIEAYRAGWNVNSGSLVANMGLAIVLVFVGTLMYKEALTPTKLAGIALCLAGMFLISK